MNSMFGRNIFLIVFVLLGLILVGQFNVDADNNIPTTKFRHNARTNTMSFLYCYSCGYRKAFEDYVNILGEKYPDLTVTGANYDPSLLYLYLSKIIFTAKILLIVLIVTSFDIFGRQIPNWWRHLLDNKLYACMMIYFVGNMIEGQLVSSGAFEITLNDVPVWSKLQTGRIPTPQELFQIIDNQLQFTDKIQDNPDFVK